MIGDGKTQNGNKRHGYFRFINFTIFEGDQRVDVWGDVASKTKTVRLSNWTHLPRGDPQNHHLNLGYSVLLYILTENPMETR